jgi:hypothetical protein
MTTSAETDQRWFNFAHPEKGGRCRDQDVATLNIKVASNKNKFKQQQDTAKV